MRSEKLTTKEIITLAHNHIGVTPVIDNVYRINTDNLYLLKGNNLFYVSSDLEELFNSPRVKGKGIKLNEVPNTIQNFLEMNRAYVWTN